MGTLGYRRERAPRWKGGVRSDKDGYVWFFKPDHHRAQNGYVKRAVLVLEEKLGRQLEPGEISHHKNGIKNDDRPENLEAMTRVDHNKHHANEPKATNKIETICLFCGATILDNPSSKRKFCNHACAVRFNKPRLGTGNNAKP